MGAKWSLEVNRNENGWTWTIIKCTIGWKRKNTRFYWNLKFSVQELGQRSNDQSKYHIWTRFSPWKISYVSIGGHLACQNYGFSKNWFYLFLVYGFRVDFWAIDAFFVPRNSRRTFFIQEPQSLWHHKNPFLYLQTHRLQEKAQYSGRYQP